MKKTLNLIAIAALAAGTAFAQQGEGRGHMRAAMSDDGCDMSGPQSGKALRGGQDRPGMSDEMRAEIRAEREAIRDLVGAARVETDEAKKAELLDQIRAKLGAVADRMMEQQQKRLTQAEDRLGGLKERIEYAAAHRDELIEEQLQRLLAGERPDRPTAFKDFPYAKGGRGGHGEGAGFLPLPPPGTEIPEDMPPPPEEAIPGEDMPPPPAE